MDVLGTNPVWELIAVSALSYTLGCVNAGFYLVRFRRGADLRLSGSGNAGATNAGRVLGPWGFLVVFLGDAAKGALAVGFSRWLATGPWGAGLAMAAAVTGHIWPVQLGFRGGKGVSTLLGATAVIAPLMLLVLLTCFGPLRWLLRRTDLAGLVALAIGPGFGPWCGMTRVETGVMAVMVAVVWAAHRDNIASAVGDYRARRSPGRSGGEAGREAPR